MTIWDRYGWKKRHPDRPWWVCEPTDFGVDLVRRDGLRVYARDGIIRFTGEEMTAGAAHLDAQSPLACPDVCAGQVWHFPKADTELLVVRRDGDSYWMADTETDDAGIQLDEWSSSEVPPTGANGEKAWLVWGPGAPWAPPEDPT